MNNVGLNSKKIVNSVGIFNDSSSIDSDSRNIIGMLHIVLGA